MAFRFILSPQARLPKIEKLEVNGFELNINDQFFNFAALEDGEEIPATAVDCRYINHAIGTPIKRIGDVIEMELLLPYADDQAPKTTKFPEPILVETNGPVGLPAYSKKDEWV